MYLGIRWFQLFSVDFQLFYFLTRIIDGDIKNTYSTELAHNVFLQKNKN
jgi:hypothetical protein